MSINSKKPALCGLFTTSQIVQSTPCTPRKQGTMKRYNDK